MSSLDFCQFEETSQEVCHSGHSETFVLNDMALAHELQLSAQQAEEEAQRLSSEHLEAPICSSENLQCFIKKSI